MKQKDLALIIVVVFLSVIVSLFVSKWLINSPKNQHEQVEVTQKLSSNFQQPSSKYFNSKSVDPTQLIRIGDSTNGSPFNN